MIDIQGVKLIKENITYIRVIQNIDMNWTIKVNFINGKGTIIGNYATEGYAQKILDEIKVIQ